ncbi:hypothetical protein H7F37_00800 [Winogradskyella sp. PAMC22761]|nr:hypothetical protein H7F37_00800 [Winogradskyella sp. PAMC22761]
MQAEELMETSGGGELWDLYWDTMTTPRNYDWMLSMTGLPSSYIDSLFD